MSERQVTNYCEECAKRQDKIDHLEQENEVLREQNLEMNSASIKYWRALDAAEKILKFLIEKGVLCTGAEICDCCRPAYEALEQIEEAKKDNGEQEPI